jgi:peptidoglycan/LPS O-acetylase OafA/YrhL
VNSSTDPAPVVRDPASREVTRLVMLDVARLIAAVGVIAAHVIDEFFPGDPAWVFGSFAVPFYLFVALYFTVRGLSENPDRGVGRYLRGRVVKLYVPFLVWNLIYDVFHVLHHRGDPFTPPWQTVWAGVYTHLYFLPFLLGVTMLLSPWVRPLLRHGRLLYLAIGLLITTAITVSCTPQPTWLSDPMQITHETLWNFYRAIAPACLAVCAALIFVRFKCVPRSSPVVALLGLGLTLACLAVEYRFSQQGLLRAGSGFGLAMIAFSTYRANWLSPLAAMGRLSFGVYLSHVLVIRIVIAFADHIGWKHDGALAILVGIAALVGGLAISAALAASKWTRWIIGCESVLTKRRRVKPLADAMPMSEPATAG